MTYTAQSSLLSPGRIGQAKWAAALTKRIRGFEANQIADMYHGAAKIIGINVDLALAQACEETGWFTSRRWLEQNNPCGLGITSDDVPGHVFSSPQRGILAHMDHLCCYAHTVDSCPVPHGKGDSPDFRHTFHDGNPALSHLQDDTRQWATKPGYVGRILAIANAVLASPDAPGTTGATTMVPLREGIIPATNANRPKLPMTPKWITVHETANTSTGANAEMHRKFLVNGGGSEGVSFHWCVDDKEAVHLIPDDEAAWHAGDGREGVGNRQSIGIETCVNRDGDWAATRRNLAQLVAYLMRRHGIPLGNVVQHNRWSGKNCPSQIRAQGLWAGTLAAIQSAYNAQEPQPPAAPPQRPEGWLGYADADAFKWEGEGVVVYRKARFFNPDKRKWYEREWSAENGYTPWVEVGAA